MNTQVPRWLWPTLAGALAAAGVVEMSLALTFGRAHTLEEQLARYSVAGILMAAVSVIIALSVILSKMDPEDRWKSRILPDHSKAEEGADDRFIPDPPLVLKYPRRFSGPNARWKLPAP